MLADSNRNVNDDVPYMLRIPGAFECLTPSDCSPAARISALLRRRCTVLLSFLFCSMCVGVLAAALLRIEVRTRYPHRRLVPTWEAVAIMTRDTRVTGIWNPKKVENVLSTECSWNMVGLVYAAHHRPLQTTGRCCVACPVYCFCIRVPCVKD